MRHRLEGKKLGREKAHRTALFRNLLKSLIQHKRITTTLVKAKELRRFMDRIITYGKKNTIASRRQVYSILGNRTLVKTVFDELAPAMQERQGGYTRVLKNGFRKGDAAPLALIELVMGEAKQEKDNIKAKDLAK